MSDTPNGPMTPETRALIGRARWSFLLSIGLLLLGLIAVGGAIVYKSTQVSPAAPSASASASEYGIATVKVPAGAEVLAAIAADGKLTVTYRNGSVTSIRIFDGKSGEMVREVPVTSE